MRLDFNVLWVEDQPGEVDAQAKSIARQMAEEGFQFNPIPCQSLDSVKQLIAEDIFTDEIDLILVDWDLGAETHGEDAIALIRDEERFRYKDVVFYSALKPAADLRDLASKNELDGIFYTSREDLVGDVVGAFESLIKKVLDLDHTRGIVMGATSDIDHVVNECLLLMHEKLGADGQAAMIKAMLERIKARMDRINKLAATLEANAVAGEFFASHEIFTAADRLRILHRMLAVDPFKAFGQTRPSVSDYLQEVVPERTRLAHVVLVPDGKPQTVLNAAGEEVTLEDTRTLRKQLLNLRAEFRGLLAALTEMK